MSKASLMIFYFLLIIILQIPSISWAASTALRKGVDFRLHFLGGNLDFTSVSNVPRTFKGTGSELQSHFYLYEKNAFSTSFFLSSRIMSWAGQGVVDEEYDDLNTFSVSPGLEFALGPLYLQVNYTRINGTAYNISSTSIGKQIVLGGPMASAGFVWRIGTLAFSIGGSYMSTVVPADVLGIHQDSTFVDLSYSFSLIYYMKMPPSRFFSNLVRK